MTSGASPSCAALGGSAAQSVCSAPAAAEWRHAVADAASHDGGAAGSAQPVVGFDRHRSRTCGCRPAGLDSAFTGPVLTQLGRLPAATHARLFGAARVRRAQPSLQGTATYVPGVAADASSGNLRYSRASSGRRHARCSMMQVLAAGGTRASGPLLPGPQVDAPEPRRRIHPRAGASCSEASRRCEAEGRPRTQAAVSGANWRRQTACRARAGFPSADGEHNEPVPSGCAAPRCRRPHAPLLEAAVRGLEEDGSLYPAAP